MGALGLWEQALDQVCALGGCCRAYEADAPFPHFDAPFPHLSRRPSSFSPLPSPHHHPPPPPPPLMAQDPTTEQRLIALYNAACTHASFGDIELAQIPLKEGAEGRGGAGAEA